MKFDKDKLHRHGEATIIIKQKGEEIKVEVVGNKYDLLHMLMAVIGRKSHRLSGLLREAVFRSTAENIRPEIEQIRLQAARLKGKVRKERSIH